MSGNPRAQRLMDERALFRTLPRSDRQQLQNCLTSGDSSAIKACARSLGLFEHAESNNIASLVSWGQREGLLS